MNLSLVMNKFQFPNLYWQGLQHVDHLFVVQATVQQHLKLDHTTWAWFKIITKVDQLLVEMIPILHWEHPTSKAWFPTLNRIHLECCRREFIVVAGITTSQEQRSIKWVIHCETSTWNYALLELEITILKELLMNTKRKGNLLFVKKTIFSTAITKPKWETI